MRRWKWAGRRAGAAGTCEPGPRWWLLAAACLAGVLGLLGWLPIAANLAYSVAVFRFKENEKGLKTVFIITSAAYAVFSFAIQNYVGVAANTVVAVTTAVSLIREARGKHMEETETAPVGPASDDEPEKEPSETEE